LLLLAFPHSAWCSLLTFAKTARCSLQAATRRHGAATQLWLSGDHGQTVERIWSTTAEQPTVAPLKARQGNRRPRPGGCAQASCGLCRAALLVGYSSIGSRRRTRLHACSGIYRIAMGA
jgi:hypothetical protein